MTDPKPLKKASFEAEVERQAAFVKGKSQRAVFEHAQHMIDVWRRIGLDALARDVGGPLNFEPADDSVLEAANRAVDRAIDACAEDCRRRGCVECAERIEQRSIFKERAALGDLEIAKAKLAGLMP
jgi:hypothetical protein